MSASRRSARAVVVVGLVVVAVSVAGLIIHRARPVDRGTVPAAAVRAFEPAAPASTTPSSVPITRSRAPAIDATPPNAGTFPAHISIALLHVSAPIEPVTVDTIGALDVPTDPATVGWWAGGPLPGSAVGTTVLDGHVDSATSGAGALFDLRRVKVGDTVTVSGNGSDVRYRITGVREYDKANLPSAALFVRTGDPRLVVITCGGPFNTVTHHYRDNIVAFGAPLPAA